MRSPSRPGVRIFLSYARADDALGPFAAGLQATLIGAGFDVWWDMTHMPSRGLSFLHEIRDAIAGCDRLVLLVGPHAVQSDYVRAEWQWALSAGKVVNPIVIQGDHEQLPAELRNLDCPDASTPAKRRSAVAHLLRVLRDPVPPLGPELNTVPEAPAHCQPRVDELTALADRAMIDTRHPLDAKPQQRITVVHGIPGCGKSALAAMFARSSEVRRAFAGGVAWIYAGKDATARSVVRSLCAVLHVPVPRPHPGTDQWTGLRDALAAQAILIVLDDVWDFSCFDFFVNVLGSQSRLIVTTRNAEIQSSLGCLGLLVGSLRQDAALRQLADWIGLASIESLPSEAAAVADQCGRLPLALALCGAMMKGGVLRFSDVLATLRTANLAFLKKRIGGYAHASILRAMSASVDALRREDRGAATRYLELAVFPPGTRVPVAAVACLWSGARQASEADVRQTLDLLQGKSLLRVVGDEKDCVELHDLQWDFVAALLIEPRHLHRHLLRRYRKRFPAGLSSAPPGDYIVEHASWHFEAAADPKGLFSLIDRRWFERKFAGEALRQSFVEDVERAIRVAQVASPLELGQLARLSAIRSTVSQLAVSVPESALWVLARCGHAAVATDAARLSDDEDSAVLFHSLVASGVKERGDLAQAKKIAMSVVEQGAALPRLRASVLAWAAQLLADMADAGADAIIDRAWNACLRDARKLPMSAFMVQTAIAASVCGRRRDALRMMATAESTWRARPVPGDHDDALVALATGWMRVGRMPRAMQLFEVRLRALRHDGVARSWSPAVELLGPFALACAEAGDGAAAARIWSRCNRRDRTAHAWPRYAAMLAARLGRRAEAVGGLRRRAVGVEQPDRDLQLAADYADAAILMTAARQMRDAKRLADLSIARLGAASRHHAMKTSSARHVTIGDEQRWRSQAETLCALAEGFADRGELERASAMAHDVLRGSAHFRWDLRHVGQAEAGIAKALALRGQSAKAMGVARAIADDYVRDECYEGIAHVLASLGRIDDSLRATQAIDSESYSDWHRSKVLAHALRLVPPAVLPRAGARFMPAINDHNLRCEAAGWLGSRLPDTYLPRAFAAWTEHKPDADEGIAMLWLARAARGRPEEAAIRAAIEPCLFDWPGPSDPSRIRAMENSTRIVTLWAQRDGAKALIEAANIKDVEYGACTLSRIALAFVDAGWVGEARRAADLAANGARKIGEGQRYGEGDVNARLARVMHRLNMPSQAIAHARAGLDALCHASGSTSAYDKPRVILESIGTSLAEMQNPQDALQTILDVVLPEPESTGEVDPALLGLFKAVLALRGKGAAAELETAIGSSRAGCSAWLRVRVAAQWHSAGSAAKARERLATSLDQAARGSAHTALDVIRTGAVILDDIDAGVTLLQVYAALRQLQSWGAPAATPMAVGSVLRTR